MLPLQGNPPLIHANYAATPAIDQMASQVYTYSTGASAVDPNVTPNYDADQPLRYLEVPIMEPIEIDERFTVALSMFGVAVADYLARLRSAPFVSPFLMFTSNLVAAVGFSVFYLISFQSQSNVLALLRTILWIGLPLGFFHVVFGSTRLITSLLWKCIHSFDVMYLTVQLWLFGFGWWYMYRDDALLVLFMGFMMWTTQNLIFSDAMSEKSRQRAGGKFMIFLIAALLFFIVVWKLSPESAFHGVVELPGGEWMSHIGYHPVVVIPMDVCIERAVTLIIFFGRFYYKQYVYPNAALNLQIPYVRRSI